MRPTGGVEPPFRSKAAQRASGRAGDAVPRRGCVTGRRCRRRRAPSGRTAREGTISP